MNLEKLKQLESNFLLRYPQGFEDPELMVISKKHKVKELKEFAHHNFAKEKFEDPDAISAAFTKLISKSSLVSTFEKVKYKNASQLFSREDIKSLSDAIWELLHGEQRKGFNQLVLLLAEYDIAKWPILTVLGVYFNGDYEVLVKPTTVKSVLSYMEVTEFKYTTKPNFDFYSQYRSLINDLKAHTSKTLNVDNGAFCGFLMITIE